MDPIRFFTGKIPEIAVEDTGYKSGIPALYDFGPPYVSPRELTQPHSVPTPPPEGSHEDKNLTIEALTVRLFVERGEWPAWYMRKHNLPAQFKDLPVWLRSAVEHKQEDTMSPPQAAARLAQTDYWPGLCEQIEIYLSEAGHRLKDEQVRQPDLDKIEQIMATSATHQEIADRYEQCFQVKYFFQVIRPVAKVLKWLNLRVEDKLFLHDHLQEHDHPNHPSYPAAAGVLAGATMSGILKRWDLEPELGDEIIDGCRAFAHFSVFGFTHNSHEIETGIDLGSGFVSGPEPG